MSKELAPDIIKKIKADFAEEYVAEVTTYLAKVASEPSIVGGYQLVRSLVYLSKGDINRLKNELISMKMKNPRDVIMSAEEQAQHLGHYFELTFDEIEANEKELKDLHAYWDSLCEEEELKKHIDW